MTSCQRRNALGAYLVRPVFPGRVSGCPGRQKPFQTLTFQVADARDGRAILFDQTLMQEYDMPADVACQSHAVGRSDYRPTLGNRRRADASPVTG